MHGTTPDEVRQDAEELQTMEVLGHNMAYFLKCRSGQQRSSHCRPREPMVYTNFIRRGDETHRGMRAGRQPV